MTYPPPGNPPPGPPPGGYGPPPGGQGAPQGGYGPPQGGYGPPQGGYGPPQGGYGTPVPGAAKTGFDAKSVNPLDWAAMAAGVLAFIFSFISYYTANADASGSGCPAGLQSQIDRQISSSGSDASGSAWHGFFGWFGIILALVGAGLVALAVFAPQVKLPFPTRLAALGAFGLAVISTLLAFVVDPASVPADQNLLSNCKIEFSFGHGFGYWASLIVIIAGAVVTYLSFQQAGGQLPGRTSTPAASFGGASGYGQPQGYQPTAPSYQAPQPNPQPQGPPPGYPAPPPNPQPQGPPPGYPAPPPNPQPQGPPPGYPAPPPNPQPQGPPPGYPAPPPNPQPQGPPPGYPAPPPNPQPQGPPPGYQPPQGPPQGPPQ